MKIIGKNNRIIELYNINFIYYIYKMPSPWVEHVRKYAKDNNISYMCAISDASKTYDKKKPIKKKSEPVKKKKEPVKKKSEVKKKTEPIKKNKSNFWSRTNKENAYTF